MEQISQVLANMMKTDGAKKTGDYAREKLIEKGYVHNEVYGWEKPEILEMFGLNPNMNGVPTEAYFRTEVIEEKKDTRDAFGKKTGDRQVIRKIVNTNQVYFGPSQKFLNYKNYKKSIDEKKLDDIKN